VKINGGRHYLWRAVDHEGEVLESYVAKRRIRKPRASSLKRAMRRYGALNEIIIDRPRSYGAAAKKSWAVQINNLHSDGRTTELRIHIYPFDDENGRCFDLGACAASKNPLQTTPGSIITSSHKSYYQRAAL